MKLNKFVFASKKPESQFIKLFKEIKKILIFQKQRLRWSGFLGHRQRCLVVSAVILFALFWLNFAESPVKNRIASLAEKGPLTVEKKISNSFDLELLSGMSNMSLVAIPSAQAAYDFTSDDAAENSDFAVLTGSGLISQDCPVPPSVNAFGNLRKEVTTYVVKNGDTPFDIAVKFDINTDTILWANNLRDGDLIRPGDKLLILPINGIRVKIRSNDTLESLAKKYRGKAEEIKLFNELEGEKLIAGNYIIIPNGESTSVAAPAKVTAPKYAQGAVAVNNWLISPATGRNWGVVHCNNGVDIANVCGTPIYAAAAGKIILSDGIGWNGGYGKYIQIKHPNGVVTLYAHASQLLVSAGEEVTQGELIALMGTTGRSTGCHLHFEVRGAKNPMARR